MTNRLRLRKGNLLRLRQHAAVEAPAEVVRAVREYRQALDPRSNTMRTG